jgi:hypothetical protein
MSIVALKRKTQNTVKASLANGQNSFSLNGSYRNQGYVGQTSLSRSLPRTLMRGNAIRGYGGQGGTYRVLPIVSSSIQSTEDNSVVKSSVINTHGQIRTQYKWIWRPDPYTSVKPDDTLNGKTQQEYVDNLHRSTVACLQHKVPFTPTTNPPNCNTDIHFTNKNKFDNLLNLTKDITGRNGSVATTQGEYISVLSGKCNSTVSTKSNANGIAHPPLPGPSATH